MKLKIKYNEKEYFVDDADVDNWTVKRLKEAVGVVTAVDASRIRLICLGRMMKDEAPLSTFNLTDGSTVHMVARAPDLDTAAPPPSPYSGSSQPSTVSTGSSPQSAVNPSRAQSSPSGSTGGSSTRASGAQSGAPGDGIDFQNLLGAFGGIVAPALATVISGLQTDPVSADRSASGTNQASSDGGAPNMASFLASALNGGWFAGGSGPAGSASTAGAAQQERSTPSSAGGGYQPTYSSASNKTESRAATGPSVVEPANEKSEEPAEAVEEVHLPDSAPPAATASAPHAEAHTSASMPPVVGVHVHVHVTLEELEALPERLERFSQRVPIVTSVHVEEGSTATSVATSGIRQGLRGMVSGAYDRMQPAIQRVKDTASRVRGGHRGSASAPSATAPPPAATARSADTADDDDTVVDVLEREMSGALQMNDFVQLLSGDWTPMGKVRQPLTNFIVAKTRSNNPTVEQRRELAVRTAAQIGKRLNAQPPSDAAKELQSRSRNFARTKRDVEVFAQHASFNLIQLTLDGTAASFPQDLRRWSVRHVGLFYDYSQRTLLKQGVVDADSMLRSVVQQASKKVMEKKPEYGPMIQMSSPMVVNLVKQWQQEYNSRLRGADDDEAVFGNPLQEVSQQPGPSPSGAGSPSSRSTTGAAPSVDDILGSALDEFNDGEGRNGASSKPAVNPDDFFAALEKASELTQAERQEIRQKVAAALTAAEYNRNANGSTGTENQPLGAEYNALFSKDE
jgi:hypothetical protein